jgi:hypothetical protein
MAFKINTRNWPKDLYENALYEYDDGKLGRLSE